MNWDICRRDLAPVWQPGDPLHPVVDGVTRPIVEVLNDHPEAGCAAMCEPLRWEGDDS